MPNKFYSRLTISLLVLGLCAFVGASAYRALRIRTRIFETLRVDVVVATRDIRIGERIEQGDVRLAELPGNFPVACFRDKSLVVWHRLILPILEGNVVCPNHLAIEEQDTFTWPPNMRAVSVAIGEIVGTTDLLRPGTRVDVLLSTHPYGRRERSATLLKSVCEILVTSGPKKSPGGLRQIFAVLLLSPEDAQKLSRARRRGQIGLSVLDEFSRCI